MKAMFWLGGTVSHHALQQAFCCLHSLVICEQLQQRTESIILEQKTCVISQTDELALGLDALLDH